MQGSERVTAADGGVVRKPAEHRPDEGSGSVAELRAALEAARAEIRHLRTLLGEPLND